MPGLVRLNMEVARVLTSPQMALDAPLFRSQLRVDPLSRCAALSLPKDSLAILPFYQSQAELDLMEQETSQARDVPYSPSFILDLANDVDKRIRNVIDFAFLPGFHNPTIAVLCQFQQTWTGYALIASLARAYTHLPPCRSFW